METCGDGYGKRNSPWMTEEIEKLINKRRQIRERGNNDYKKLKKK